MPTLSGPHLPPNSDTAPDSAVIMFHGIGSDGNDLMGLAPYFMRDLPNTAFHAPNAPQPYAEAGFGYQWFPRGALVQSAHTGELEETVNQYVDGLLNEYHIESSRCVLLGFSQGSMVAMHVAPRREATVAGVVAFSGSMPTADTLLKEQNSSPPMVLIHGVEDGVLSAEESKLAAQALHAAGIPATLHLLPGLGHAIDARGIRIAVEFMKQVLNIP